MFYMMILTYQPHIIKYPSVASFNVTNTLGFLPVIGTLSQRITGLLSVMYYSPSHSYHRTSAAIIAMSSDTYYGFPFRQYHINLASPLPPFPYLHRGRAIYYIFIGMPYVPISRVVMKCRRIIMTNWPNNR